MTWEIISEGGVTEQISTHPDWRRKVTGGTRIEPNTT